MSLFTEHFMVNTRRRLLNNIILLLPAIITGYSFAESACPDQVKNLGDVAQRLACQMPSINKFMIAIAYLSGIGFGVAAVFKFKQVKDNPTQIPISTPFALLAVSTLLVFLPSVVVPAGNTIFGTATDSVKADGSGDAQLMPFD